MSEHLNFWREEVDYSNTGAVSRVDEREFEIVVFTSLCIEVRVKDNFGNS